MKKVNFNALNHLSLSEEQLKKALEIPRQYHKPVVKRFFTGRNLITAASIVLAFALGFSASFLFKNNTVLSVRETSAETLSQLKDTPSLTTQTEAAEERTVSSSQAPTGMPESLSSLSEQWASRLLPQREETRVSSSPKNTDPTEKVTQNSESSSSPTEKPTQHISDPTFPPDTNSTESHSEYVQSSASGSFCIAPISAYQQHCLRYVYCSLYNLEGELIGDDDRFSEKRKAFIDPKIGYVYYFNASLEVALKPGWYRYEFYEGNGDVFFDDYVLIP